MGLFDRSERKRLNIVQDVCKYRVNRNAKKCFDDDCREIKEMAVVQTQVRRRGDGTRQEKSIETGNIIFSCEKHDWRELFSTSQLDQIPMPERTTSVSDTVPTVEDPSLIER